MDRRSLSYNFAAMRFSDDRVVERKADAELLTGVRLLASGTWRASHEAFETAWRRSQGEGRDLLQALHEAHERNLLDAWERLE